MPILSVQVTVDTSEKNNGIIRFNVGPFGFPARISELKEIMQGGGINGISLEHLVRTIAIAAKDAGGTTSDLPGLKTIIESLTFRI